MEGVRLGWLTGWLGAAVGVAVTGAGAFGGWTTAIVAAFCVALAIVGFIALRWKRVAFRFNPNGFRGLTDFEGGKKAYKPWYAIECEPGDTDSVLTLKLRHPRSAEVIVLALQKPGQSWARTWRVGDAVRRKQRSSIIRIPDHRFLPGEVLAIGVQNDGRDLPTSDLTLYRST